MGRGSYLTRIEIRVLANDDDFDIAQRGKVESVEDLFLNRVHFDFLALS